MLFAEKNYKIFCNQAISLKMARYSVGLSMKVKGTVHQPYLPNENVK